jgi:serine protease DegS
MNLFRALNNLGWPVACGLLVGWLILLQQTPDELPQQVVQQPPSPTINAQLANNVSAQAPKVSSYADAVEIAAPSVVNIYTRKKSKRTPITNPLLDTVLQRQPRYKQERDQTSLGSGVIVDSRGYLLTNEHVVRGADEISVLLHDGREGLATLIGTDPETDLAVLKLDLPNLKSIASADPANARVGDIVLAIGNPYGFGHSVSQGIISGTGRYGLNLSTYENFIQTDAAINPGNSGGALIDSNGKLLGINAAIYSQSGNATGIGLAIPANLAMRTLQDIIQYGQPVRGWLGVEAGPVITPNNSSKTGKEIILITGIEADSPAANAGLQPGDLIIGIDNKTTNNGHTLMGLIAGKRPGESVSVMIQRQNQQLNVPVTLGLKPIARK